jgi:hypothetical protein
MAKHQISVFIVLSYRIPNFWDGAQYFWPMMRIRKWLSQRNYATFIKQLKSSVRKHRIQGDTLTVIQHRFLQEHICTFSLTTIHSKKKWHNLWDTIYFFQLYACYMSWCSDGLWAGRPWFNSRQRKNIFLFPTTSRPTMAPIQPPMQWVQGVKRPSSEADNLLPSIAEVENDRFIPQHLHVFIACWLTSWVIYILFYMPPSSQYIPLPTIRQGVKI